MIERVVQPLRATSSPIITSILQPVRAYMCFAPVSMCGSLIHVLHAANKLRLHAFPLVHLAGTTIRCICLCWIRAYDSSIPSDISMRQGDCIHLSVRPSIHPSIHSCVWVGVCVCVCVCACVRVPQFLVAQIKKALADQEAGNENAFATGKVRGTPLAVGRGGVRGEEEMGPGETGRR